MLTNVRFVFDFCCWFDSVEAIEKKIENILDWNMCILFHKDLTWILDILNGKLWKLSLLRMQGQNIFESKFAVIWEASICLTFSMHTGDRV